MRSFVLLFFISYVSCVGFIIQSDKYRLDDITPTESCTDNGCVTGETTMTLTGPANAGGDLVTIFIRDTVKFFDYNITVSIKELFYGCGGGNPGIVVNSILKLYPLCACFTGDDFCLLCPSTLNGTAAFCFDVCPNNVALDGTCLCGIIPFEGGHKDSCCVTGCNQGNGEWCALKRNEPTGTIIPASFVQVLNSTRVVLCPDLIAGYLHTLVTMHLTPKPDQKPQLSSEKVDVFEIVTSSCILSGVLILNYTINGVKSSEQTVIRISQINVPQGGGGEIPVQVEPQSTSNKVIFDDSSFFVGRALTGKINYRLSLTEWCWNVRETPDCFGPLLFPRATPTKPITVVNLQKRIGRQESARQSDPALCVANYPDLGDNNRDLILRLTKANEMFTNGFTNFTLKEECELECDLITDEFEKSRCKLECSTGNFARSSLTGQVNMKIQITIHRGTVIGITQKQCIITDFKEVGICDITLIGGVCQVIQFVEKTQGNAFWSSPEQTINSATIRCINEGIIDFRISGPPGMDGNKTFIQICVNMSIGVQLCKNFTFTFIAPTPFTPALPQPPTPDPPIPITPPSAPGLSFIQIILIVVAIIGGIIILVIVGNIIGIIRTAV